MCQSRGEEGGSGVRRSECRHIAGKAAAQAGEFGKQHLPFAAGSARQKPGGRQFLHHQSRPSSLGWGWVWLQPVRPGRRVGDEAVAG